MENREWINDYLSLKQVNPGNPFIVPEGYFDSLEDRIVARKNLEEYRNNEVASGFLVPENYFEELAGNIQSRLNIESYLDSGETGFTVPEDYFETMGQQLQSLILIEEISVSHEEHFTVPEGYFDKLTNDILNKTANAVEAKQKGKVRKLFTSAAFKYATAACFALAIGGGILINQLTNPDNVHKNSFLHKQLSAVPVDEIKNYLQLSVDAGETQNMILTDGTPVNDDKLKDALQDYVDSVQ